MTLVTYLGKKDEMYAHGYDFSNGPVDVPETDSNAIAKFLGNRYFHCDNGVNHVAAKFYVFDIENIRLPNDDLGNPQFKRIRGTAKGEGFQTMEAAKLWIKTNGGKLDQSHYIKKSTEGISEAPKQEEVEEEKGMGEITIGVFKKKEDGEPYSRANKFFTGTDKEELKTEALDWMAEEGINPDERLIMVK